MPDPFKVNVTIERRPDGGLRVWSDDIPGLILSHVNQDMVLDDLPVALRVFFREMENIQSMEP